MLLGFLNHLPGYSASFDLANLCIHTVIIIFIRMTGRKSRTLGKVTRILQFWQAFITENYTWVLWTQELLQDWVKYSLSLSMQIPEGGREKVFLAVLLGRLVSLSFSLNSRFTDTRAVWKWKEGNQMHWMERIKLGHWALGRKEIQNWGSDFWPGYHRRGNLPVCFTRRLGSGSCAFPPEPLQWGNGIYVCGHEENQD